MEKYKNWITAVSGAALLGALGFGAGVSSPAQAQLSGSTQERPFTEQRVVPETAGQMQLSFAPIVKETAPAVVNVFTSRTVRQQVDPFFEQFFGGRMAPRERMQQSLGSGVIVRSNGVIVTNAHVVKGADTYRVELGDRREFEAELIALDEQSDIAVLQIDTKGERLPVLKFAAADDLEIGDLVLAIGNPFGVGQTVTSGIVSALARTNVTELSSFIQTDAAVNPGNSGGALVNMNGELIGVNTAIFSRSGGSNGIGFAIPAPLVARAVESAIREGQIVNPWIGARTQAVTSDMAEALGLDRPRGAIVGDIYPGGPAERAGLTKGDVILTVDGTEVNDESGLRFRIATLGRGHKARFEVWTGGRVITRSVTLDVPREDPPRDERTIENSSPFAGLVVVNMSPKLAEELDFDPFVTGAVISKVRRRSPASRHFRPGDILLSVNGRSVKNSQDFEAIAQTTPDDGLWEIELDRNGRIRSGSIRYR